MTHPRLPMIVVVDSDKEPADQARTAVILYRPPDQLPGLGENPPTRPARQAGSRPGEGGGAGGGRARLGRNSSEERPRPRRPAGLTGSLTSLHTAGRGGAGETRRKPRERAGQGGGGRKIGESKGRPPRQPRLSKQKSVVAPDCAAPPARRRPPAAPAGWRSDGTLNTLQDEETEESDCELSVSRTLLLTASQWRSAGSGGWSAATLSRWSSASARRPTGLSTSSMFAPRFSAGKTTSMVTA